MSFKRERRDPNQTTCFVTGSTDTPTERIIDLLQSMGIRVANPIDAIPGQSLGESISLLVRESDFVVALLAERKRSSNAFFELGIATALGKPLFLIGKRNRLPPHLQRAPRVHASVRELDVIDFHLRAFLREALYLDVDVRPPPDRWYSPSDAIESKQYERSTSTVSKSQFEDITLPETLAEGQAFERQVEECFRKLGLRFSSRPEKQDRGFDFSLWIPELPGGLSNPLLVVVKAGRLSSSRLGSVEKKFRRALEEVGQQTGLLVIQDGAAQLPSRPSSPPIIRVTPSQLATFDHPEQFSAWLARERTSIVHGGPSHFGF